MSYIGLEIAVGQPELGAVARWVVGIGGAVWWNFHLADGLIIIINNSLKALPPDPIIYSRFRAYHVQCYDLLGVVMEV